MDNTMVRSVARYGSRILPLSQVLSLPILIRDFTEQPRNSLQTVLIANLYLPIAKELA
jgi:hypothetical protein